MRVVDNVSSDDADQRNVKNRNGAEVLEVIEDRRALLLAVRLNVRLCGREALNDGVFLCLLKRRFSRTRRRR